MKLDKYKLIIAGLVGITVCSGLMMVSAYADTPASSSSSANASVTVSNTINLTLTGGDLVIDNLTPGNASDSNIITATITSNSPYGYHLSATTGTSSGTTSLVNTADSNFSFTNLSANKATLNDFSDNAWGYSYSTDNGTSWISGDYGTALSGYNGLILDNDDSGATGTTLYNNDSYAGSTAVKFKIGAKSSSTQAAGTYTNTVNFYAVVHPGPTTIANATTMQEVDLKIDGGCPEGLPVGQAFTLVDSRDNNQYKVARLADGNCWMLDNLALDLVARIDDLTENNTNIDVANDPNALAALQGTNVRNPNTDANGKYATARVANWTSSYRYSVPLVSLTSKDTVPNDVPTNGKGGNKTGGYYNYCAASAGSYCYGNGTSYGTSSGNATSDICPKGWRMPTGGASGEYAALASVIYGSTSTTTDVTAIANYRNALSLPISGIFNNGSVSSLNSSGYWWSSTRIANNHMRTLYIHTIDSILLSPTTSYDRSYGLVVRCMLR